MRKALRAFFGPLVHDMWIYPAVPLVALIAAVGAAPDMVFAEYATRTGIAFAMVVCLGLPAHILYEHVGSRLLPERFEWWELLIHVAIVGSSVVVGTELCILLVPLFLDAIPPDGVSEWRRVGWVAGSFGVGSFCAVAVIMNRSRERLQRVELRESEARQASLAAQLQALQARVQPHFLFNCLNTVAGLIEEDPKRANRAVEMLADLFRYTLDSSKQATVALERELLVVRDFLELETLRYGDRLKTALHTDPACSDAQVPPLVLQPIVENAVLHGIANRRGGGRLELVTKRRGDELVLTVEDDGPGPGHSAHTGAGAALADLRRRLQLLYGARAGLREGPAELGGYRVEVVLPFERAPRQPGALA